VAKDNATGSNASRYEIHLDVSRHCNRRACTCRAALFYAAPEPGLDLGAAEAMYRQQVAEAYGRLDFSRFESGALLLGEVPLRDVFVRLTLTVEKVIREPVPPEELSKEERPQGRSRERLIILQEPVELDQALSHNLLIVGEVGAGRSTLLRWLAVTFARRRQRDPDRLGVSTDVDLLPILVELRHLPDRYPQPEDWEMPYWIQYLPECILAQPAFTGTPPELLAHALAVAAASCHSMATTQAMGVCENAKGLPEF
jgi:hypothetical protein